MVELLGFEPTTHGSLSKFIVAEIVFYKLHLMVEHMRIELICFSPCNGDDHSMQSRAPDMMVIKLNLMQASD